MKKEINTAAKSASKIDELFLFREMANSLKKHTSAMFIQEVHGRRGWVQFFSSLTYRNETKEIADLLIICKNQKNEIKISFLQAKLHKKSIRPFLQFYGDYLQLELLRCRPNIQSKNNFRFPYNILNFSNYRSLTTYGIFYYDTNKEIDLLYTIADNLQQVGRQLKGPIVFPGKSICPQPNCFIGTSTEMCSTCEIDLYESGLLSFFIGAPINQHASILFSIQGILSQALRQNKDVKPDLITEFINAINKNSLNQKDINEEQEVSGYPNILLINSPKEAKGLSQLNPYFLR